ncbi:MAG: hypothetical protein MJ229_00850 [bacterium]|nr:hypothetical protein [bacterium]
MKEFYIKHLNNLSFAIIEFLFVVFLLANIGFILHISITWIYLILALPIVYFSLIKLNNSVKYTNWQFFTLILLTIGSLFISNGRNDFSFDGLAYHFQAMFCLKNGWNPLLQDSFSFAEKYHLYANNIWVQVWPKFCETVSACFYQLTNIIESGFVVNCLIACAVFFRSITVLSLFSERKYLNLLFSSLIILNPVVIAQFFTMYVDLIMYFMFILFILNIMEIIKQDKFSNFNFWNLVFIGSIMPNLKITGLFYLAIISIIFLFTYKKYAKTYLKACLVMELFLIITSLHPYLTNYIRYNNPLFPIMWTKEDITIKRQMFTVDIRNKSSLEKILLSTFSTQQSQKKHLTLKYPFQMEKKEVHENFISDTRLGGFGHFWSGIFILSFLLLIGIEIKDKTDRKIYYSMSAIILLSFFSHSEAWWPRYVPQIWFFPIFTLYMSIINYNKIFFKNEDFRYILCHLLTFIIFLNSAFVIKETIAHRSICKEYAINFYKNLEKEKVVILYKNNFIEGDSTILTYFDKYNIKYKFADRDFYLKNKKDFKKTTPYFIFKNPYYIYSPKNKKSTL